MKKLISPANMRQSEKRWFAQENIPSIDIMENAALALADLLREKLPCGAKVYFACGAGGNGGDGTGCARLLRDVCDCIIIQPAAPTHPDAVTNLRRAEQCGVSIFTEPPAERPDAWVDALFGTGLSRAPEGAWAELIERIDADRARGSLVVSADIPSGLNGATGTAFTPCVTADHTVTFGLGKTGLFLADGLDHCGEIHVSSAGFPEDVLGPADALLIEREDLPRLLPPRRRNVHKGDCGHLLIVAGSFGMAGAAALSARAALRSGTGLVTIACPRSIVPILQTLAPQAMCVPLEERDGALSEEAVPRLEAAIEGKTAIAMGCGLGRSASEEIVRAALKSDLPCVVDADALNLISAHPELTYLLRPRHILTPHPGEAARLPSATAARAVPLGRDTANDPLARAKTLTGLGATVLYKGAACVIASEGETYVSASGASGMARGGSGDILTGMIGALLAEPSDRSPALTAAVASELHGLAGALAEARYGNRGMNSADILEFLPEVFP